MKPKLILAAALLCGLAPNCVAKPLKVYILAGQSNMQGHVNVSTFESMADDPKTAPILKEMRDDLEKLQERMEACWPKVDAKVAEEKNDSWENKMKHMAENFTQEEWKRMKGASNGGYHYLGAAKIMAPIGKAFATELVSLRKPR
jgi:hypothetical protein